MGAFAVPLLVAGTAVQAIGAIQQGNAAKAAADYNAANLDRAAEIERSQANQREEAKRREARGLLGKQAAAFAQSGGGLDGSAADVMRQSATNAELDALTLRYEGDIKARGFESEARMERFAGKQARKAGYFKAAGSILSGASAYAGMKARSAGAGDPLAYSRGTGRMID